MESCGRKKSVAPTLNALLSKHIRTQEKDLTWRCQSLVDKRFGELGLAKLGRRLELFPADGALELVPEVLQGRFQRRKFEFPIGETSDELFNQLHD